MKTAAILRAEWLFVRRDRAAGVAYLLFAVVCAVALAQGVSSVLRASTFRAELEGEETARIAALHGDLTSAPKPVEPWRDPRNAGSVGRNRAATYAFLPAEPLAALRTTGAKVVSVSTLGGALDRSMNDIDNPRLAGIGSFDLAFVVVVLLPLFILALTFDVVTRDRESGALRLLLAQGTHAVRIYVRRALVRTLPLILIAVATLVLSAAAASASPSGFAAPVDLALAAFAIGVYALFWIGVAFAVQGLVRTSAAGGLAALAAWLVLVVIAPVALAALVDARVPIPSRIERTILVREATRRASLEGSGLLARYYEDHPELSHDGVRADPNDFYARQVAVSERVRAARAPVEARYRTALAEQRRLVGCLSAASPVVVLDRLLDDLAGTSRERSDAFVEQVTEFQSRFAAYFDTKVARREALTAESLAQRPTFTFRDVDVSDRLWTSCTLALWLAVALLAAFRGVTAAVHFERHARS
ncbi:DUF3526 domain-containing protein [Pendulispora albinea]|uniref:DUF3526 domain-containing protein n=1 Tax=Pendulispora albinea TaxID=2741071 RepID=A0ABZ2M3U0_9BACT